MSEHSFIRSDYNELKNELFLTEKEKYFSTKMGLPEKYSLIHSQSKQSFTKNKECYLRRHARYY